MPLLVLTLLLLSWVQLFKVLRPFWTSNEQYAYGWFVPFLAGALLWRQWRDRPAAKAQGNLAGRDSPLPAWVLVGAFFVLLLPFRLLEAANPGWIVLLWIHTLTLLAVSLVALRFWGGVSVLRRYWFPLFFLLTCVPWPSRVDAVISDRLMRGVARATVEVVGFFNVPALQHGKLVQVAGGTVGIEEACSGIRSLQTSIMLALLLGELFQLRPIRRLSLIALGILVALVANVARTSFLTWSGARQGFEKMHTWHAPAGMAVVGIVCASIWLLASALAKERTAAPRDIPARKAEDGFTGPLLGPGASRKIPRISWRPSAGTNWLLALCCLWVPLTEGLTFAWYHWPGKGLAAATPWSLRWPTNEANFQEQILPGRTVEILHCTDHKSACWTDAQGNGWEMLLLSWSPTQGIDTYVGGHNPEQCMSAPGRSFVKKMAPITVREGTVSIQFQHRLFEDEHQPFHVFQGTWEPLVPPNGQRLFGDDTFKGRIRNVLERRLIRGGITLEVALSGPETEQEAKDLLTQKLESLITPVAESQTLAQHQL
jgi:exosortase